MHLSRLIFAGALLLVAFVSGGCGGGSQQTVTGRVSYKGEPVAKGEIVFADAGASAGSVFAQIENGQYRLQTTAGEKKVRITASKETGRMIVGGMDEKVPERVDIIPAQYNTATTLVRTVPPGGSTVIDFNLE